MKLPDAAAAKVKDMVLSFLPYEDDRQATTKEGIVILDLYNLIIDTDKNMQEWQGFVMYLIKKVDDSPELQKKTSHVINEGKMVFKRYDAK